MDKNICGKIPLELHDKIRLELEREDITTSEFLRKVIEEHFMEGMEGALSMATRTIAVQVTEAFFGRLKAVVAKKGCKQKEFLIACIERAIEEAETEFESQATCPATTTEISAAEETGAAQAECSGCGLTEEASVTSQSEADTSEATDTPQPEDDSTEAPHIEMSHITSPDTGLVEENVPESDMATEDSLDGETVCEADTI